MPRSFRLRSRSRRARAGSALNVGAAMILAASLGALVTPSTAIAGDGNGIKVTTQEGRVKGFVENGVAEFLGIPYAEPPVGNLRWKPSKKHEPWTNVLQAKAFGPTCAQITTLGVFAGPPTIMKTVTILMSSRRT